MYSICTHNCIYNLKKKHADLKKFKNHLFSMKIKFQLIRSYTKIIYEKKNRYIYITKNKVLFLIITIDKFI
jgi:hypothetical protein